MEIKANSGDERDKTTDDEKDKDLSRYNKVSLDIGFLQKCELFHVFPKFANFKLSRREFQDT